MLKAHITTTIEMLAKEFGKSKGTIDMLRKYIKKNTTTFKTCMKIVIVRR